MRLKKLESETVHGIKTGNFDTESEIAQFDAVEIAGRIFYAPEDKSEPIDGIKIENLVTNSELELEINYACYQTTTMTS
ncbi:hypothetical protein OPT61_g2978 [Boeremia exigua]|uniref:Uncharacterized protein n=1 Tax=Boeremia exigua TaxID=749465 RepID=A0ACC2IJJ9_9PLEO|nr:hypothetical protein OPT61_g2978 [Boeremia exigua]